MKVARSILRDGHQRFLQANGFEITFSKFAGLKRLNVKSEYTLLCL
jgi:hypothetical protein